MRPAVVNRRRRRRRGSRRGRGALYACLDNDATATPRIDPNWCYGRPQGSGYRDDQAPSALRREHDGVRRDDLAELPACAAVSLAALSTQPCA
jgi:hypothetical protein